MPLDKPLDAVHRTVDTWLTPRRAIAASVASMTVIALIAATPGSPYQPVLPEETGAGPLGVLARLLWLHRLPHGVLIALGFVAMMAAGIAFLLVLYACERGLIPVRTVITLTIAYTAAVFLLPLLLSRDVFSYTYYGRLVTQYHRNPYVTTPADIPTSDVARYLWPGWRDTPSVYGPVFVWLAAAITGMIHSLPETLFAFRAVALGATLGAVWFVYRLMQRVRPSKTAYAVAFIGLNPVVLFHTAGGGHVDALVMLSIAAAIYFVATDRPYPATAMLTFGALVKVSAAVPLLLLIIYVTARTDPAKRTRTLAGHLGLAAGLAAFAALPFMQSTNPTLGMVQIVQHASWIAPPELLERILEAAGRLVAGTTGGHVGVVVARLGMYAALLTGGVPRRPSGGTKGLGTGRRVPGGELGMGAPRDDVVLAQPVPLVLLLDPAGRLGAPQGPAPYPRDRLPRPVHVTAHDRELPAARLDARGPGDRAPAPGGAARLVPARPLAASQVRRPAQRGGRHGGGRPRPACAGGRSGRRAAGN